MKLTVAANYDSSVVSELAQFPVDEVYGKLPADFVGGGRPSYMGSPATIENLTEYIGRLGKHGIAFNYLLNSSCHGNREWSRAWQRKLMKFLDRLAGIGVTRLTVSTPFLFQRIKTAFPKFVMKVGIYAHVNTPRRASFWEDLGADAITLTSFSLNRDFRLLSEIRASVKCDLQLIANHICLPGCALQTYHQNSFAHASDGSRRLLIDYCFLRCSRQRLEDPSAFVKAQWIRPEDLGFYERLGFSTFKLLERGMPSPELLKRVRAYSSRTFEGNLAEILLPYGFRETPKKERFWAMKHFFKPFQASPRRLSMVYNLAKTQGMLFAQSRLPILIDSTRIPRDFVDGFADRRCSEVDCAECRYCAEIAQTAVSIDEDFRTASLKQFAAVEHSMIAGELWNV